MASFTYRNASHYHYTWPSLTGANGSTLSLAPGETVTLDHEVDTWPLVLVPSPATADDSTEATDMPPTADPTRRVRRTSEPAPIPADPVKES